MIVTALGKYLKKARIDLGVSAKEMAMGAGVGPATLSAIENGKQDIKEETVAALSKYMGLSGDDQEDFEITALASNKIVKINLESRNQEEAEVFALLARHVKDLSPQALDSIKNVVKGKSN